MVTVNGSQLANTQWTTIPSMTVDTSPNGERQITYFFEATTNDVNVQVQGSVNNINWITLNTRDMDKPDMQNTTITVLSAASAVAIISPSDFNGVNSGFQFYRVQIQGVAPYGTLDAWAVAK